MWVAPGLRGPGPVQAVDEVYVPAFDQTYVLVGGDQDRAATHFQLDAFNAALFSIT